MKKFLDEVIAELKKVSWPNRKETINYTIATGVTVLVVCILIWICDTIFARLFHIILQ